MIRSDLIKKVKNKIYQNKQDAENLAKQNYIKASQNPLFKSLDINITTLNIEIAKLEVNKEDASQQKVLLKNFLQQQNSVLETMGLKSADLQPNYSCKKCNDSGFLSTGYCDCYQKYLNEEYQKLNNATGDINQTFENSKTSLLSAETAKAYGFMEEWCNKFGISKIKNVVLSGGTGVGKTYLVNAIANKLSGKNVLIQNLTAFSLNNQMLKYHTTFEEDRASYLDSILNCDLLIIDDLGTETILKNVTKEYLYLVINERQLNGKSTIVTTNLSLMQIIDRYGERVFSRLMNKANSILLNITGNDLRQKR